MSFRRVFVILSILSLVSCSSRKSTGANDAAPISSDSIPEAIEVVEEILPLPDTIFPSASMIRYKVDVFAKDDTCGIASLDDMYADTPGAFTFRKGSHRNADFSGKVEGTPSEIVVDWTFDTDFKGTWGGGTGWTGQPLYIEWPDSILSRLRDRHLVKDGFSGREIMVGSLCGQVYFIDFETGQPSRDAIDVMNPIKGTMSLDPTLNGNLYVGQGIPENDPFGALVIDLYANKVSDVFGFDNHAWRRWGAYDSSPVRLGQYLFRPGENGTLYKFLIEPGKLKLHSTLRYTVNGACPGIESSMSIYRNYGYIADNHGNIICVNLITMTPVWLYRIGDDVDSSLVLIEEGGTPYVYTGCEVDKQVDGDAKYVKLNGIDGTCVWEYRHAAKQFISPEEKHFDGGFYSTALPGVGDCNSLLFVNCVYNDSIQNGRFLAINRNNGKVAYTVPTKCYAWSSPVGFTNSAGQMFVVTGDCAGFMYLINGIDGKIIFSKRIGNNFESSPVVTGNHLVVGTRGRSIFRMTVK